MAEILDLLARSVSAFGRFDEAEEIYEELLAKDPHAPAPSQAAPAIVKAFLAAKKRLYSPEYVKLSLGKVTDGTLEVLLVDPWQQVDLLSLVDAESAEKTALAVKDYRSTVDREKVGRQSRIEAQSASGQIVAALDLSLVRSPKLVSELTQPNLTPSDSPAGGLATSGPAPRPSGGWLIAAGTGTAAAAIATGIFTWRGLSEKKQIDASLSSNSSQERISSLSADQYRSLELRANRDLSLAIAAASASLILGAVTVYFGLNSKR